MAVKVASNGNDSVETYTINPNTTYEWPVEYGWLSVGILGFMFLVVLSIIYIVVWLTTARLRRDPGKWLQAAVVIAILLNSLWYMVTAVLWMTSDAVGNPSTCMAMVTFVWYGELIIEVGIILVTVERTISIWHQDYRVAGFTERDALITLAISITVTFIVVLALLCGLGSPRVSYSQLYGGYNCSESYASHFALYICSTILELSQVVVTVVLAIRLCRSRRCEAEPFPYDRVLHILIGNGVIFVNEAALYLQMSLLDFMVDTMLVCHIILLLLWLLLDSSVRVPLRRMLCPLCPGPESFGDRVELVEEEE